MAARRSIRATTTSSTEPGRALMESPFCTAATSSRTKSGLPPERSTSSCNSLAGSGVSWVAARASSAASAWLSGWSSMRDVGVSSGAMKPELTSRRVTHQIHDVKRTVRATWPKRSADASSMKCASSTVIRPACGRSAASSAMDSLGQLRPPELLLELQGLAGLGNRHRDRHPDERCPRDQTRRPAPELGRGTARSTHRRCLRPGAPGGLEESAGPCSTGSTSHSARIRRRAASGRRPSHAAGPPTATFRHRWRRRSPPTHRVLPPPVRRSPRADAARALARRRAARRRRRRSRPLVLAPRLTARTGLALPFTRKGSSSVESKPVPERARRSGVVRISPGAAFAIRRAARLTASPITVKVRR